MSRLSEVAKKPNDQLIEHLEKLLDQAKKGEIRSIVDCVVYWDGDTSYGWRLLRKENLATLTGQMFSAMTQISNAKEGVLDDLEHVKEITGID